MASERVVKVSVVASVNNYLAGMDQVAKAAREGRSDAQKLTAQLEAQKKAFTAVGRGMLVAGGLVAAGLALAINRAAEFDQAMSNVQAATHETAANMALLRQAALDAGAETVYSAKEAAGAIEELAKAGVSTKNILGGGLRGALDLAAAGQLDVADAAGIAATTLGQFKLRGEQASHVADLLAAGAGKAMGDVSDLSQALGQTGTVANSFGISIEETTGTLAAFASAGLLGSDAGTSMRAMLLRLANPTGEASEKMKELGIQAYDAQGNFVGMTGLAGQLQKGLSGLTQEQRNAALAIIFGQDAIRSANILYTEGAKGIADWTKKVDDSGYAAETAATRLDNLKGDLEKLGGAFDTALIGLGESGQGPLRAAVQGITEVVDSFNGMPEGAQSAIFWVGAVASAAALAGGTFLIAVPKVAAYRVAVAELGPAAQKTSRLIGGLTKAIGTVALIGTAVTLFDQLETSLRTRLLPTASELANALTTATSAKELFDKTLVVEDHFELKPIIGDVKELHSVLRTASAEGDNLFSWLNANTSFTGEGAKFNEFREGWQKLAESLTQTPEQIAPTFKKIRDEFGLSRAELSRLIELSPTLKSALTDQATNFKLSGDKASLLKIALGETKSATDDAAASAMNAGQAYQDQAGKVEEVRQAMRDLFDQINAQNSAEQRAIQSNAQWVQGLEDLGKRAHDAGVSLDQTTAAGAANADMLAGLAGDAQAAAAAQYEVDQKTMSAKDAADKYVATLADQRQKFIDSATAAGFNAGEVQTLADKIFAMPSSKEVQVIAETATASQRIRDWISSYNGSTITFNAKFSGLSAPVGTGTVLKPPGFATGGRIPGAPSSRDNTLAAVATGEYIVNASATAKHLTMLEAINSGRYPHYANGGYVQPQYASRGPIVVNVPSNDGGGFTLQQTINPAPGMSEEMIGRVSAEKAEFKFRGR